MKIFRALNKIGIKNVNEYKEGNWYGNTSIDGDGSALFESLTNNLTDLIEDIEFRYHNGKSVKVSSEKFESLQPRTVRTRKYGRCYEVILLKDKIRDEFKTKIIIKTVLGYHVFVLN